MNRNQNYWLLKDEHKDTYSQHFVKGRRRVTYFRLQRRGRSWHTESEPSNFPAQSWEARKEWNNIFTMLIDKNCNKLSFPMKEKPKASQIYRNWRNSPPSTLFCKTAERIPTKKEETLLIPNEVLCGRIKMRTQITPTKGSRHIRKGRTERTEDRVMWPVLVKQGQLSKT